MKSFLFVLPFLFGVGLCVADSSTLNSELEHKKWRKFTAIELQETLSMLKMPSQCYESAEDDLMGYFHSEGLSYLVYCRDGTKRIIKTEIRIGENLFKTEIVLSQEPNEMQYLRQSEINNEIRSWQSLLDVGDFELRGNEDDVNKVFGPHGIKQYSALAYYDVSDSTYYLQKRLDALVTFYLDTFNKNEAVRPPADTFIFTFNKLKLKVIIKDANIEIEEVKPWAGGPPETSATEIIIYPSKELRECHLTYNRNSKKFNCNGDLEGQWSIRKLYDYTKNEDASEDEEETLRKLTDNGLNLEIFKPKIKEIWEVLNKEQAGRPEGYLSENQGATSTIVVGGQRYLKFTVMTQNSPNHAETDFKGLLKVEGVMSIRRQDGDILYFDGTSLFNNPDGSAAAKVLFHKVILKGSEDTLERDDLKINFRSLQDSQSYLQNLADKFGGECEKEECGVYREKTGRDGTFVRYICQEDGLVLHLKVEVLSENQSLPDELRVLDAFVLFFSKDGSVSHTIPEHKVLALNFQPTGIKTQ